MNIYYELSKEFLGLLMGIVILVIGLRIAKKRQQQLKSTKRVKGTVLRMVQEEDDINSSLYYPVVKFTTAKKEPVIKRYHIGKAYTSYSEGMTVTIFYNKNDPGDFFIDNVRAEYGGVALIVIGIITVVMSIAFFIFYMMIWTW
jgi:hypothetical protein